MCEQKGEFINIQAQSKMATTALRRVKGNN
jgi:hypothetical protein